MVILKWSIEYKLIKNSKGGIILKLEYKKFIKTPYILAMLILIFVIIFGTYRYFTTKSYKTYEGRMHIYIKDITSANSMAKNLIKDQTIDIQASLTLLPEIITELKDIKLKLDKETPSEKYIAFNSDVSKGVSNNILLYEQLCLSLSNPNAKDITKSFEKLQEYKSECLSNYEKASVKKLSIKLPKDTEVFLVNAFAYINEIIKLNRDSDIISSQKNDFILTMDEIVSKFKSINSDYEVPLKRVREEKKSYEGVIDSIDKNIETLVFLTEKFNSISIPNNALDAHNNFKVCLSGFNKYIQELRDAVSSENLKSKDKSLTEEELDILYENASENYEELKASFENFILVYEKYKEK